MLGLLPALLDGFLDGFDRGYVQAFFERCYHDGVGFLGVEIAIGPADGGECQKDLGTKLAVIGSRGCGLVSHGREAIVVRPADQVGSGACVFDSAGPGLVDGRFST